MAAISNRRQKRQQQQQTLLLVLLALGLALGFVADLPGVAQAVSINIWKHRYPHTGGGYGYYPYWGGYYRGGYGGISFDG